MTLQSQLAFIRHESRVRRGEAIAVSHDRHAAPVDVQIYVQNAIDVQRGDVEIRKMLWVVSQHPHIRPLLYGEWVCHSSHTSPAGKTIRRVGIGATPHHAYWQWFKSFYRSKKS